MSRVEAPPRPVASAVAKARAFAAPYDYWHDRYQAYYVEGIAEHLRRAGGRLDRGITPARGGALRLLRQVRNASRLRDDPDGRAPRPGRWIDQLARAIGGAAVPNSGPNHPLVGRYIIGEGQSAVRVCVDAQDGGDLAGPGVIDWSDLYFKTNAWVDRDYPRKVLPLANGNPLILGRLGELRALRSGPHRYDVAFVVRAWGGRDEAEGVEHNLRLIEAINRVPCRKYLLAYLVAGDVAASARRLEGQGIPWTTRPIPLRTLWAISAASRLAVIRLGMHQCVPWRMMDTLAMGSCAVLDQGPRTTWHRPLVEGEHFLGLGVRTGPGAPLAPDEDYRAIPDRIRSFLADEEGAARVRSGSARAFDLHFAPEAVGRHLVETASSPLEVGGKP